MASITRQLPPSYKAKPPIPSPRPHNYYDDDSYHYDDCIYYVDDYDVYYDCVYYDDYYDDGYYDCDYYMMIIMTLMVIMAW